MHRSGLALALAMPLLAQAPDRDRGWSAGAAIHTAVPLGGLSGAVNDHLGFGFALQGLLRVGGGLVLRPQLEGTGFRVTRYDPVAWWFDADSREVLRTYRLGVDALVYLEGGPRRGPYLLGGVALQSASFDRVVPDGQGSSTTTDSRLTQSGLALTGGAGYQINPDFAVEFRYYRFDYQDPAAYEAAEQTRRRGQSLLIGLAVRF
jgi:opacity protein-like surface antigen